MNKNPTTVAANILNVGVNKDTTGDSEDRDQNKAGICAQVPHAPGEDATRGRFAQTGWFEVRVRLLRAVGPGFGQRVGDSTWKHWHAMKNTVDSVKRQSQHRNSSYEQFVMENRLFQSPSICGLPTESSELGASTKGGLEWGFIFG